MKRFDELHFCPALETRAMTASCATFSMSEVSATMKASFQPSSRMDGFRYFPASDPMILPAPSDPVRLTPAISGLESIYSLSELETMIF